MGDIGQSLDNVLSAAQLAVTRALGGKAWSSSRRRLSIAGYFTALDIQRSVAGRWRVRRWVVIAPTARLSDAEQDELSFGLRGRASAALTETDAPAVHVTMPRFINRGEARAVAQLVTRLESPIDKLAEPFLSNLKSDYGVTEGEDPANLVAEYRASSDIRMQYARSSTTKGLGRRNRVFGLFEADGNFSPLTGSALALAFVEYCWETKRVNTFGMNSGSNSRWAGLVEDAQRLTRADTDVRAKSRPVASTKK